MQKKSRIQALQLSRETLRRLDTQKLEGIGGGATFTASFPFTGCYNCTPTNLGCPP